ncbi:MAG: hypothetical protein ACQGVC_01720 [Myxococcota bacterium]
MLRLLELCVDLIELGARRCELAIPAKRAALHDVELIPNSYDVPPETGDIALALCDPRLELPQNRQRLSAAGI